MYPLEFLLSNCLKLSNEKDDVYHTYVVENITMCLVTVTIYNKFINIQFFFHSKNVKPVNEQNNPF